MSSNKISSQYGHGFDEVLSIVGITKSTTNDLKPEL